MRTIDYNHSGIINDDNPVKIFVFADTHISNPTCNEGLIEKNVDKCKREGAYWVHVGDWVDGITPKDKRNDARRKIMPLLKQYKRAVELFRPIAGEKCLGILAGNHDEKPAVEIGDGVEDLVADALGVPYLGYSGAINLRIWHQEGTKRPNYNYVIFMHHGHGAGATIGSYANNLHKLSHKHEANLYIMGHYHKYLCFADYKTTNKKKKIRWYLGCPGYFDAYEEEMSNYVQVKALQPFPIGCVKVELFRKGNEILPVVTPLLE